MRKLTITTALTMIFCLFLFPGYSYSGNVEMTDEQNVKLAKHRAMLRSLRNKDPDEYHDTRTNEEIRNGLDNAGCGSVDIGNAVDQSFGGPREIEIIITGDVINANNNC